LEIVTAVLFVIKSVYHTSETAVTEQNRSIIWWDQRTKSFTTNRSRVVYALFMLGDWAASNRICKERERERYKQKQQTAHHYCSSAASCCI